MAGQHKDWTREEHILAFNLYCKNLLRPNPHAQPRVIQLACPPGLKARSMTAWAEGPGTGRRHGFER